MKVSTTICLIGWAFVFGFTVGAKQELKRANIKLQHAHDVITSGTGRTHATGTTKPHLKAW